MFDLEPEDTARCEHCEKLTLLCELEELTPKKCSILETGETYLICEYCIGLIETEGEGVEEVEYWNEWVTKKRLAK